MKTYVIVGALLLATALHGGDYDAAERPPKRLKLYQEATEEDFLRVLNIIIANEPLKRISILHQEAQQPEVKTEIVCKNE